MAVTFEWDPRKDRANEKRYFCFGTVGGGVLTVRFTYRDAIIRIFGAGYWRKGKRIYEQENHLHTGSDREG